MKKYSKNFWKNTYLSLVRQVCDLTLARGINVYCRIIFKQQIPPDIPQTNTINEISMPASQSEMNWDLNGRGWELSYSHFYLCMHSGRARENSTAPMIKVHRNIKPQNLGRKWPIISLSAGTDLPEIKPETLLKMDNREFIGQMKERW